MLNVPDLTLPDVKRGKLESQWDLRPLLYRDGAAAHVRKVNALIDSGQLGAPLRERLILVNKIHDVLRGWQAGGYARSTISWTINCFRTFVAWAEQTGHPVEFRAIKQTYLEWTAHLIHRVRILKNMKRETAYSYGSVVGGLLDNVLENYLPLMQSTKLECPRKFKTPLGAKTDKQNLEQTYQFGHFLQDICDHLTLDVLWGPLPVRILLREGAVVEEWSKLRAEEKVISSRRDTRKRRENAKYVEALRANWEKDCTLRTRYPLANLRIEAELLMFIGQTGMNLAQAHRLKLCHFSYSSYLDGYQVRDYKQRRGGPVMFEVYKQYKKHFERYLEWRRAVFPDSELLFPLVRFGRADDKPPTFTRIRAICGKIGLKLISPQNLRGTRVNWFLRRSRDPELTADMNQHTRETLLTVYERPSLQVALSEVTRFWSQTDPAFARTVPVAPGECNSEPMPAPGMPMNATQPDCVQRSGCLWCAHHRDIDSQDYVWALACFHRLKVIELSKLRGPREHAEDHPVRNAVTRIQQKMHWFRDSNELRRSWFEEAMARVEEGNYHPDWVRLIEDMEGKQA